jgi:anthranilate/para-aminobenzoate synthase component II
VKKLIANLYWRICRRIGYRIVFMDYYDSKTFNLIKKNSHMALLKYVGKVDENGYIKVEQVWQIQVRKIQVSVEA